MSTAEQATTSVGQAVATEQPLDAVLAATERRQSIRNNAAAILGVSDTKVCDLLRNVWKTSKGQPPLTDQEMFVGMSMIARFDLDPIAKEVYVTRDGKGRLLTIVGIDGWIKAVLRTDHYDGFEQEAFLGDKGKVEWVETRIYSTKISRPTIYRAYASEYGKLGGYVAGIIPTHMLKLFSFRHAARFFVPLAGVTTQEESDWNDYKVPAAAPADSPEDPILNLNPKAPPDPPAEPAETADKSIVEPFVYRIQDPVVKLKKQLDAIIAEYAAYPDVSEATMGVLRTLAAERWKELRPPRGEESNAPKPAPSDPDPAIQASADNREKLLADIAGATPGGTLDIDDKARNLAETGDLTPDDHHLVMKASGARRLEAGGGQ